MCFSSSSSGQTLFKCALLTWQSEDWTQLVSISHVLQKQFPYTWLEYTEVK